MVPTMNAPLREKAISRYQELLGPRWRDVHQSVLEDTAAREIVFLGRPVVRSLQPYFIDEAAYRSIQRATLVVGQALDRMAERVAQDPALRRWLGLTPRDEHFISTEPFLKAPFARLDGFLGDDGTLRFLEYNSAPFGTIFTELVAELFAGLPIMAELGHPTRYVRTSQLLLENLVAVQRERIRSERALPNIAVVAGEVGRQNVALTEGMHMMRLVMKAGANLRLVRPEELVRRDGGLWAGDYPIDCLAVTDANECHTFFPEDHVLWKSLQAREIWMMGSQALKALQADKGMFALLTGPESQGMFDTETEAILRRHVPWTRMVRDERTELHGESIELLPFIARHRERFVLKPTIGYGGKGVTLGWAVDQAEWEGALARALERPHVVQERISARKEVFPCLRDGELHMAPRFVDFNPYYWNGQFVDGALVRMSDTDLLNITSGFGSLTPLLIVGG